MAPVPATRNSKELMEVLMFLLLCQIGFIEWFSYSGTHVEGSLSSLTFIIFGRVRTAGSSS